MSQCIRRPILRRLIACAALCAISLLAAPVHAQVLYGSIVGNVNDPQGSFVPGVTITATNTGTGAKAETVTDESGAYTLRNLLPGVYDVSATLTGFREHQEKAINVTAGNPVRVNLTLAIGALSEVVQVTSERTLIQTDKADLHTELSSEEITNLPLNVYRNYQALMNLVPGATPFQEQNATIDTPGRSLRTWVNGTQPNSNATRIDGAVSVNIWLPHHVGYIQPAETIDTVNISTNSFDAEYGMAAGAASTVITKSGTNDLRGSAFFFRNQDELNANTFNNNAFDLPKDDLTRNTYGGTLGGPVVKNKFFYFGSMERYQERRSLRQNFGGADGADAPGRLHAKCAAKYPTFRLFNPFTGGAGGTGRDEFANFTIPASMISSISRDVHGVLSRCPTRPATSTRTRSWTTTPAQVPFSVDRDNYDAKLTFQRSPAHSIWGKFSLLNADVRDNFILGFDDGSLGDTKVYVATAGHTWTLGPTLILDGNFGANIQNQIVTGPDYGTNYGIDLGIPGVNNPNDIHASGLPTFDNGYTIGGTPNWMPLFRKERSFTFSSALTKVIPHARPAPRRGRGPPPPESLAGRVRHLWIEGRLRLQRQHHGRVRVCPTRLEQLRRLPAWIAVLQFEGRAARGNDRTGVAECRIPAGSLGREQQADGVGRPPARALPAHDAQGSRHRASRLRDLHDAARRPRRRAGRCRASTCRSGTSRRASARCTG